MTSSIERLTTALADRYRVLRELGAGGMATVYLAHDVKHERDVAIKVLKPELGAVLGVERFLSEIRVTANLQHPNLLPLFDSGEADGLLFYVMPFVDGETLRARLERERQLPVEEALRLTVAIAQALDYAHRRGVIHRDLKPENILLADGQPLVADFGIALAVSKAGGQRVTQTGLSLGTPQYMSPEQATGDRVVDARTDIYSLGAMAYEMLTGEPPHSGTTAQAIIARLMTEEVRPLSVLRRTVPPGVDAAVRQALEKLAADRFATAGDFALSLQGKGDMLARDRYQTAAAGAPTSSPVKRWREIAAWSVAALAVGAFLWTRTTPTVADESPVLRVPIDPPLGDRIMTGGFPFAVSPQGDQVAYVTRGTGGYATIVQRLDALNARVRLAASSLRGYAFSPDGRELAYADGFELRRIAVEGGSSTAIGSTGGRTPEGLVWMPDGTIVIGSDDGLFAVPARGGTLRPVVAGAKAARAIYPALMPDGKTVIARTDQIIAPRNFAVFDIARGEITPLPMAGASPLGMTEGHLVYLDVRGDLAAMPFDLSARKLLGDPVVLVKGPQGASLSPTGALAYLAGTGAFRLVLTGAGREQLVRPDSALFLHPRISPDGRRIAVVVSSGEGSDIWMQDRTAGTFSRLTTNGVNRVPEWSSDSRRIIFTSITETGRLDDRSTAVLSIPVDGSGGIDTLFISARDFTPLSNVNEAILSPDGRWLVVRTAPGANRNRDIYAVDLANKRAVRPLAEGPTSEVMPRLSADGRWLAYQSDVSGRAEIYVRPFPGDGARVQVSDAGGSEPLWDASGRTLYYRAPAGITAVSLSTSPELTVGARRLVLPSSDPADPTHPSYDVTADGRQFLILRPAGGDERGVLVHNWARELRRKLQDGRR